MDELFFIPSQTTDWAELSATESKTPRFRKEILKKGKLLHPVTGTPVNIDDTMMTSIVKNFKDGVVPSVTLPLADDQNRHSDRPDLNTGEIIDVEYDGDSLYIVGEVRKPLVAEGIRDKTITGISAYLAFDYKDTRSGKKVGPTLLHGCLTNRPYVHGLDKFEEVIMATADTSSSAVVLTAYQEEKDVSMTKEELIAALRDEHGIDVEVLQEQAQLSNVLASALTEAGAVKLSADETSVPTETIVMAVAELAENNAALSARVDELVTASTRKDAEIEIDALIADGKILPAKREASIKLKLTSPDLFEELVPDEALVRLSDEQGTSEEDNTVALTEAEEVERVREETLSALLSNPSTAHYFKSAK